MGHRVKGLSMSVTIYVASRIRAEPIAGVCVPLIAAVIAPFPGSWLPGHSGKL